MVFSSYIFIFVFMPIVLVGYYALGKFTNTVWQKIFLVGVSLFFYGYVNWHYLFVILSSIACNYIFAILIQRCKRNKPFLLMGILFNVFLLGYFKYCDFFLSNMNAMFGTNYLLRNLALPLGISFFTFQQLSFLISIYKKDEIVEKFLDYCVFVTFFPQLVAGPIVSYGEMISQFKDTLRYKFKSSNLAIGLYMFSIGLFKKVVLADTVATFADHGFTMKNMSFIAGWAVSLSYTLQIYFDFSGYSDMAMGLAKMFNINLPCNFYAPYKSESITEFWRRWHMTLGRALSTFIYKPLGGNRKGIYRTCANLFVTFLISGLWHGAAWTFVLWGALQGFCVVVERIFKEKLERLPRRLRQVITFLIINALWVLFRADGFGQVLEVYKGMCNIKNIGMASFASVVGITYINFPTGVDIIYVLLLLSIFLLLVFRHKSSITLFEEFDVAKTKSASWAAILFGVSLIYISRGTVFIYYNF